MRIFFFFLLALGFISYEISFRKVLEHDSMSDTIVKISDPEFSSWSECKITDLL